MHGCTEEAGLVYKKVGGWVDMVFTRVQARSRGRR